MAIPFHFCRKGFGMATFSSTFMQLGESAQWALLSGKVKVKQHYKYDCGAACLASVAAFYGIRTSLAKIRMTCGCTPDGISIRGLIDGAGEIGLVARGLFSKEKDMEGLRRLQHPSIAHITDDGGYLHYIVIYGTNRKWVKVMDPAEGKFIRMPIGELEKKWSGYLITVVPDPGFCTKKGTDTGENTLLKLIKSNIKELAKALCATAICIGCAMGTTFLLQQIIDSIVPAGNAGTLAAVCIMALAMMLFSLEAGYLATRILINCSMRIETSLVSAFSVKLTRLPQRFFENCRSGDISSRTDDIHLTRSFITGGITGIAASIITVTGSLALMFLYNSRLAIIIVLFLPVYLLLYKISSKINRKYGKEVAGANSRFESALLENIGASSALRHYNASAIALDNIGEAHISLSEKVQHSARAVNILETISQGVSKLLLCTVIAAGSFAVLGGEMTLGELVGFYTLCTFFTTPVNDLIGASDTIAKAKVACERIQEILSIEEEENRGITIPAIRKSADIEIRNLTFRHPGREILFNKFNTTIKAGCITRIEGDNGCGKSTLLKIILGDYAPQEGEICYGGTSISLFNKKEWRDIIGYVEQHPFLLNASILENITLGDENPDIGKIMHICRELSLEETLNMFPQGILTVVGGNGNRLSGGESQKICIARAMYKEPEILIFDEATSFLDTRSETAVAETLCNLKKNGKTIIFISHKRESHIIADNVVFINECTQSGNLRSTNR